MTSYNNVGCKCGCLDASQTSPHLHVDLVGVLFPNPFSILELHYIFSASTPLAREPLVYQINMLATHLILGLSLSFSDVGGDNPLGLLSQSGVGI